jgi:hypothetical protein
MATIQIRCPNSGLWAWSDLEIDPGLWEPTALAGQKLLCGICGERHTASSRSLRIPPWSQPSLASSSVT